MIVAAAVVFVGSNVVQWIDDLGRYRGERLPMMFANWLGGLVFYAAAVLLLVHDQRERHGIVRFQPVAGLLVGFGVVYLIATTLVSSAVSYLSVPFYRWAFEQDAQTLWMVLYDHASSLITLILGCLLPLWLVLHLARSRSERVAPGYVIALRAWQVALGVALCFTALTYRLIGSLSYGAMYLYSGVDSWASVFLLLASCALPFTIVMAAVRMRLPAWVLHFAAGRVLAASLVLALLWAVAILPVAILVINAIFGSPYSSSPPLYLLPSAILLLALLWPLARWCSGWFFAEQMAQSSPR